MNNYRELPDDRLVSLYAEGDDTAFDVLLYRHKNRLYNYICYIVKDTNIADDIFQETFIKVITSIRDGKYKAHGRFYGWLTCMAHNLVIDFFRSNGTHRTYNLEDNEFEFIERFQITDNEIDKLFNEQNKVHRIRLLMSQLPKPQQEIVHMRFYRQLTFKEIAQLTNVSINTALGRMRYALINMRNMCNSDNNSVQ